MRLQLMYLRPRPKAREEGRGLLFECDDPGSVPHAPQQIGHRSNTEEAFGDNVHVVDLCDHHPDLDPVASFDEPATTLILRGRDLNPRMDIMSVLCHDMDGEMFFETVTYPLMGGVPMVWHIGSQARASTYLGSCEMWTSHKSDKAWSNLTSDG